MFFWYDLRIHVDAQGTLIIQGVAPEDAGNYSCQATNEVGTDEETVTLYYTGTWAIASQGTLFPPSCSRTLSICGVPGPVPIVPDVRHRLAFWWGDTQYPCKGLVLQLVGPCE